MVVKVITIVQDFIRGLDRVTKSMVLEDVELLRSFGKNLGFPHSKKINKIVYELRTVGKLQVRLIYGFIQGECYVVHGFLKKTNKIPTKEIKIAESRLRRLAL